MSNHYEGRLLNLDTVDLCNRKFSKDCKVTFLDVVPVIYNFQNDISQCLGSAKISQDDNGLNCEVFLTSDIFVDDEYFVGGYYDGVKTHSEDSYTIIDACNLVSMSIVPECNSADKNLKIKRKESDI